MLPYELGIWIVWFFNGLPTVHCVIPWRKMWYELTLLSVCRSPIAGSAKFWMFMWMPLKSTSHHVLCSALVQLMLTCDRGLVIIFFSNCISLWLTGYYQNFPLTPPMRTMYILLTSSVENSKMEHTVSWLWVKINLKRLS